MSELKTGTVEKTESKNKLHTLNKVGHVASKSAKLTNKGVIKTGKFAVVAGKEVVDIMTSENSYEMAKKELKTAKKTGVHIAKKTGSGIKKFVDRRVEKKGSEKTKRTWNKMKTFGGNMSKTWNRGKKVGGAIKTYGKALNKDTDIERAEAVVKTTVKYATKPIRNKVKKSIRKIALKILNAVRKAVVYAVSAVVNAIVEIVVMFAPYILACLVVVIMFVSVTSVFGGLSFSGSSAEDNVSEIVSNIETSFENLQNKKDAELENYKNKIRKEMGDGTPPAKTEFKGISDKEYEELIKTQWKKNVLDECCPSFIDYKGLAIVSQYFFNNEIGKLNNFIQELDNKGLIESYDTMTSEYEYEVKWVEWTPHLVSAKTEKEVIAKANEYTGKYVEKGEPTKEGKNKWTIEVKTGKESKKTLTYIRKTILVNNGVYTEFVNELPQMQNGTENSKEQTLVLMDYSYREDTFMSPFDSKWNQSGGVAAAGGKYVSGVANGKLFNWRGSPKDFEGNGYENASVVGGGTLVGQCTWFAEGRWTQTHKGKNFNVTGDAGYWFSSASGNGMSVGKAPKPHSVMVLAGGNTPGYEGCGHVAFIEEVEMKNGQITSITISQGNVGGVPLSVVCKQPMQSTDIRKYKSVEEYLSMWGNGLSIVGYIY